jgi:methyltransferase (TIGR00027 family)
MENCSVKTFYSSNSICTSVQTHKRATLESSSIPSEHVTFVSVDFTNENAMQRLIESGFDTSKKTLFIWEGVALYLSEADVRKTMRDIRNTATAGSVLLADSYAERFIEFAGKGSSKKTLEQTGEGLGFGLNFSSKHQESLSEFVKSESMSVGECFFLGEKNDKGPFVVVVEMVID